MYRVAELEGQLRNTIVGRMSDTFAESQVPFLDMAANQIELGQRIAEHLKPAFSELGLTLDSFVVENLSLPEELQKRLDRAHRHEHDRRHGEVHAIPGGAVDADRGRERGRWTCRSRRRPWRRLHDGAADDERDAAGSAWRTVATKSGTARVARCLSPAAPAGETKFCVECGKSIPKRAKFCPECGNAAVIDPTEFSGGCEWVVEAHGCDRGCAVGRVAILPEYSHESSRKRSFTRLLSPCGISFQAQAA